MRIPRLLAVLALVAVAGLRPAAAQSATSVYTDLEPDACEIIYVDEETGDTSGRCPGMGGYALIAHDSDARVSLDVVSPGGAEWPLQYTEVITSAFSSLGPRAEWRVRRQGGRNVPFALIVRVNAFEDPENPSRATSYLAVARISSSGACVTDRIRPSANANTQARQAADRAANRPCLSGPPR